jgi:hypothetical protein
MPHVWVNMGHALLAKKDPKRAHKMVGGGGGVSHFCLSRGVQTLT